MNSSAEIQKAYWQLHADHPGMEVRDIAREMDLPEATLISTFAGQGVWALRCEPMELLADIHDRFPSFTCHTRQPHSQFESRLQSTPFSPAAGAFAVSSPKANCRVTFEKEQWQHVFFVEEETHNGWVYSIQIFDATGAGVQKIFLPESKADYFPDFRQKFSNPNPSSLEHLRPCFSSKPIPVDPSTSTLITPFTCSRILTHAREQALPILFYLKNTGVDHRHEVILQSVEKRGPWIEVSAKDFQAKIRFNQFGSAFLIQKDLTILTEFFDKTGEMMLGLTVLAPEHQPAWKKITGEIPR